MNENSLKMSNIVGINLKFHKNSKNDQEEFVTSLEEKSKLGRIKCEKKK